MGKQTTLAKYMVVQIHFGSLLRLVQSVQEAFNLQNQHINFLLIFLLVEIAHPGAWSRFLQALGD